MEKRIITVEQINKILNYLASKPFIEVHQIIGELQQLPADSCVHSVKETQ
jgi:hypothetical protein